MHIHGASMDLNSASLYSAAAADKAAATRRADEVRRKLMKCAASTEGAPDSDEAALIGQWLDASRGREHADDLYHPSASGRDPDFG